MHAGGHSDSQIDSGAATAGSDYVTQPTAPYSILVVDDEPDSLETMRMLLEGEGFEVRAASSGAQALQMIAERRPDIYMEIGRASCRERV